MWKELTRMKTLQKVSQDEEFNMDLLRAVAE
jgi:hypothetical protein